MSETRHIFLYNLPPVIIGGDGEEDASSNSADESGNESTEQSGSAGSASEDESGDAHNDSDDDSTKGLKSALEKERKARRDAERELRKHQKAQEDKELADKDEVTRSTTRAEKAESKVTKLATGLLNERLAKAISKAAEAQNFTDPEDAVSGVDRSLLSYEQDDDDPSDITIDTKSVEAAVKKLATSKPHWLKQGTSDGAATGSTFGNSGNKNTKQVTEDALRAKYPALNRH